jgi:uncharacterized protein
MLKRVVVLLLLTPTFAIAGQEQPPLANRIVEQAVKQVGVTLRYDAAYQSLPFPGGDVPMDRGVCTDVVVRAYRGVGIDLQLLVNQDMKKAFSKYPRVWGLSKPDPNIDHRRVLNLMVFFTRHGEVLPLSTQAADYKPGDIVSWNLPDGRPHIGMVTDKVLNGTPLMVHNIGAGAQVEDVLFTFTMTGHYRYNGEKS